MAEISSMYIPMATMNRKLQKVGATGGLRSRGKSFRPLIRLFGSWKARKLTIFGMPIASMLLRSASLSGTSRR